MNEIKLKPFDIEAAKRGEPVITRDGRKARIICFDMKHIRPLITVVELKPGKEGYITHDEKGVSSNDNDRRYDIFMAKIKREGWVNILKDISHVGDPTFANEYIFETEKTALNHKYSGNYVRVSTQKITWEE